MLNPSAWPLKRLLTVGFFLSLTALVAVALLGYSGQHQTQAAFKTVYLDRTVPLGDLGSMHYLEARNRIILQDATMRRDTANAAKRLKEFDANMAEINQSWQAYMATELTPVAPSSNRLPPPGEKGKGGLNWYLPSMISVSGKLTPAACTSSRISFFFGSGLAISSSSRFSAGPKLLQSTAFIAGNFLSMNRQLQCRGAGIAVNQHGRAR